jgi:hypothetical protein
LSDTSNEYQQTAVRGVVLAIFRSSLPSRQD